MGAPTRPKPRVEEWESEAPAELAPPRLGRSLTLPSWRRMVRQEPHRLTLPS